MSPNKTDLNDAGNRLAALAVEHVAHDAEHYCNHECERIALDNEPQIKALNMEGYALDARRKELDERLRTMPPPTDPAERKRRVRHYAIVGAILALAAFAFTIIGLGPYRLGLIGVLYCLGIALVTPFAVDEFLKVWKNERVMKSIVTVVFLAAILGGGLLAAIRGELLARKAEVDNPAVTIDGAATTSPMASKPSFYESTGTELQLLMLLLALAIDLGSGIALHRACVEWAAIDGDYEAVMRELLVIRGRLGEIVAEITALENGPGIFAATFWRDFYSAALTQTIRKAVAKGVVLLLMAIALWPRHAAAAEHLNIVVALDRSTSESVLGEDNKTPFARNVDAIAQMLTTLPPNSHITIISITADSLADPRPLLEADISGDVGYFGERLADAREVLVSTWRARTTTLSPTAKGTDIIGALVLASEIFHNGQNGSRSVLTLFSDMRNNTKDLGLEATNLKPPETLVAAAAGRNLITELTGVTVYVVGVNAGGKNIRDWQTVKQFWLAYFSKAGARCAGYSILATPPVLSR